MGQVMPTSAAWTFSYGPEQSFQLKFPGRGRHEICIHRNTATGQHVEGTVSLESSSGRTWFERQFRSDKGGFLKTVDLPRDEYRLLVSGSAQSFVSGAFGCSDSGVKVSVNPLESTVDTKHISGYVKFDGDTGDSDLFYVRHQKEVEFVQCDLQKLMDLHMGSNCKDILVYIHGYNVTDASAMAITARDLKKSLRFNGSILIVDWPVFGGFHNYGQDSKTVNSIPAKETMCRILEQLATLSGKVNFLVHSLGNKLFLNSFFAFAQSRRGRARAIFGEVFMAAPDVAWDSTTREGDFVHGIAHVLQWTSGVTVYVNSGDRALFWSQTPVANNDRRGHRRAGRDPSIGRANKTIHDRYEDLDRKNKCFETIICDRVAADILRHGYFMSKEVLAHMRSKLDSSICIDRKFLKKLDASTFVLRNFDS